MTMNSILRLAFSINSLGEFETHNFAKLHTMKQCLKVWPLASRMSESPKRFSVSVFHPQVDPWSGGQAVLFRPSSNVSYVEAKLRTDARKKEIGD